MRWRVDTTTSFKAAAICSWHGLNELWRCLHLVQKYVESRPQSRLSVTNGHASLKRKSPGADTTISRDQVDGILTPQAPTNLSRSASVSISSDDESDGEVSVYNAVLDRKNGWILARPVRT